MQNIKVSIIVPVYDVADYLWRCLDSCVNQTLQEIEVIVVNDSSPDIRDTEIMKEYEKKYPDKVKCIWHKENKRLGGARNTGIRAARGEFIYCVDSDDYIELTAVEKMYNAIIKENADMAVCDCNYVNGDDIIRNWRLNGKFDASDLCERIKSIRGNYVWFIMIRKSVIEDNDLYFPEKNGLEDSISPLWYLASSKIARINEVLYYYVQRTNSIAQEKKYIDCLSAIEAVGDTLKTNYFGNLDYYVKKMLFGYYIKDIRFYCNYVCENYPNEFVTFYNSILNLFKIYNAGYDIRYEDIYSEELLNFVENNIEKTDFNSKFVSFYKRQYDKIWLNKIRKLIQLYPNKNLTLWGAGFFGKQNAKYMNMLGIKFEVTDINTKIYGEKIVENIIVKPWEELKDNTDVVVSSGWAFEDVRERLSKECPNIEVVNLELL